METDILIYYAVLGGLVAIAGIGFILWANYETKKSAK